MVRILSSSALLLVAVLAMSGLSSAAGAVEAPSIAVKGAPVCLIGLGSGDGSPAWSQLDVTSSRSVDLDPADGAGLTVACGTVTGKFAPATIITPPRSADPSAKGDFGSL